MAFADRPIVKRVLEAAEENLGVTIARTAEVRRLHTMEEEFGEFKQEAEELAFYALDYFGGRPSEMRPERRRRLAQRSRIALIQDPLAGAEAQLLGDFAFGKGVSVPTARNPAVQDVIDEGWCHDEATEALTEDGWLGYAELRRRWEDDTLPRLAAWRDGVVEFEAPLGMVATRHSGRMVRCDSRRGPSFMVTPNHRMVTRRTAMGTGGWAVRQASELRSQEYVPTAGIHGGVRVEAFTLPGCFKRESEKKRTRWGGVTQTVAKAQHVPLTIPMDAWLRWVGLFVSEGSLDKPTVCQQLDSERLAECVRICAALGIEGRTWTRAGRMWEWQPKPAKQFRGWLREHVGVRDSEKRLPEFVFALAVEQKLALLDGLMLGDGSPADWRSAGRGRYYTCSQRLADDVQRLATLCGWRATIRRVPARDRGKREREQWAVYLHARSTRIVTARARREEHYDGIVWCFRMPSGTMLTRRDGAVLASGNSDPINQQTMFSFQSQRKLSNELLTCGELFPTLYEKAGKVRFGRLDPSLVVNVVPDPENRLVPLWFAARERTYKWDFTTDSPAFTDLASADNYLKVKYWPHWRNVEIARQDRQTEDTAGEQGVTADGALEEPPKEKLGPGLVYHLAINQTGEQLRGNPPWARSLRFMSAMNVLTEAHVTMAQAASTFIARRAMKGSPRQIGKAATSVLNQAGELGASALRPSAGWGVAGNAEPTTEPFVVPGTPGPFPPGSWWQENMDSSQLSALNLNSGAGQMAQTAQIVRAPVAAASGFGQHYLGDASNANLATASTLELPATMHVGSWQECFEGMFRWCTDRMIEAAVKAGRLGGAEGFPDSTPLGELHIEEAEDRKEMESRTGKDLSYEFTMPFPGRRQLSDVTTMVQVVSQTQDPNGVNIPLRRLLLRFLFEQIGIDDVSRAVEECIPEKPVPGGIGPQPDAAFGGAAPGGGGGAPAGTGAKFGAAANEPKEGAQPYGAKSGTAAGGGSAGTDGALEQIEQWLLGEAAAVEDIPGLSDEQRTALEGLDKATDELFRSLVATPQLMAALGLGSNGEGTNGST